MRTLLIIAALWTCGCGPASPPLDDVASQPQLMDNGKSDGPTISWEIVRAPDGGSLTVNYTVTNHHSQVIYLCDELLSYRELPPRRADQNLIVRNGPRPGRVDFACGAFQPKAKLQFLQQPLFKKVEPGESQSGSQTLPLPLTGWHNLGAARPLNGKVHDGQCTLTYFVGEPKSWREVVLAGGEVVRIPKGDRRVLISEPIPLPL